MCKIITVKVFMSGPEFNLGKYEKLTYEHVGSLDPLGLDDVMARLPELNHKQDTVTVLESLKFAVEFSSLKIDSSDRAGALASLRDLDFLLSSLLRHGVDVISVLDGLEEELIRLGTITQTVPRGTVYTYAAANPSDSRRRTFTGTVEEGSFIDAVRDSCLILDDAVDTIGSEPILGDESLSGQLEVGLQAMRVMTDSIINVRRSVSPEFFSNNMRPFFEPIDVAGKTITGSGGAQMQMLALDSMLWGIDSTDDEYKDFFNNNVQYLAPSQHDALVSYGEKNGSKSILSLLETNPELYPESLEVFAKVMAQVKKFRYPHRKLAKDNFKIRDGAAVGSGQYKPGILDVLIDATEDALVRTRRMTNVEE